MKPPPRDVCESKRYVERCPLVACAEHIKGTAHPLRRLPVCGRVLLDVAVLAGGFTQTETAYFLGVDPSAVRQAEKRGLAKCRRAMEAA